MSDQIGPGCNLEQKNGHVFCRSSSETIDHLLMGCAITSQVWERFLPLVRLRQGIPAGQSSLENHWLVARLSVPRNR